MECRLSYNNKIIIKILNNHNKIGNHYYRLIKLHKNNNNHNKINNNNFHYNLITLYVIKGIFHRILSMGMGSLYR